MRPQILLFIEHPGIFKSILEDGVPLGFSAIIEDGAPKIISWDLLIYKSHMLGDEGPNIIRLGDLGFSKVFLFFFIEDGVPKIILYGDPGIIL